MKQEIRISKKSARRGDGGHKVVSVRMRAKTMTRLDDLFAQTNRSRNELINKLLEEALDFVVIVGDSEKTED